ncbi:MAG: sterol desaturase family protein [Kofleriaceae bacterium]
MSLGPARRALRHVAFPLLWAGPVAAAWAWIAAGGDLFVVMVTLGVVAGAGVIALEYVIPYRRDWRPDRAELRLDATHIVLSSWLVEALPTIFQASLVAGGAHLATQYSLRTWPTSAPFALQLLLSVLISQLAYYVQHRLAHRVPWLWRMHVVHHSVDKIYWLNATRVHPLEALITITMGPALLMALGVPAPVLAVHAVSDAAFRLIEHSNIDFAWGPVFGRIFNTSILHRWHHSKLPAEADANYGSMLSLWDYLFRTRKVFAEQEPPIGLGSGGAVDVPASYWSHLLLPWRWRREYEAARSGDLAVTSKA